MTFRFDHAIIAVDDLDKAVEDYQALGFHVVYGGAHASGTTHNALIVFADGSYLELMALTGKAADPDNPAPDYGHLLRDGAGIVGYAIVTTNLDADAEALRGRGLTVSEPEEGSRQRKDGVELEWKTLRVGEGMSPFFIEDVTDRDLRVPTGDPITTHENGVVGVHGLAFVFPDAEAAANRYEALLGKAPDIAENGIIFHLEDTDLLINPEGEGDTNHDDAPYRLILRTTNKNRAGLIQMTSAHNARLVIVYDEPRTTTD